MAAKDDTGIPRFSPSSWSMRRHFGVSVLLALGFGLLLLVISSDPHSSTSYTQHTNSPVFSSRLLRLEPTWELQTRDNVSSVWKALGVSNEQRVLLRVHYSKHQPKNKRTVSDASGDWFDDSTIRSLQQLTSEDRMAAEAEELAVNVSFEDIYKTIVFITATWALGNLSTWLHMPSLVGEIMSGFLLGPPLADFCPFPEAMVLIGSFGLIGLILESGIDLDVGQLKETGKRAILMAFTGTALPLLVGMGLGRAAGQELQSSIAIGATFSPSSLGVSANVLSAGEVLNTPTGQMIVASSVVDDVLGLILLSILDVFVRENTTAFDYCIPFISSFGYLIVLGYSGITWMPYIIEHKIMARFPEGYRELVAFCLMFLLLLVYLPLLNYSRASYLTGTFLAGLTFSQINSVHAAFAQHGRGILDWLLRIFFAATIGFQVPITRFQDGYVLKWGAKFLVPILAKMPLGLYVPRSNCKTLPEDFPYDPYWRDVWITSLALVCRGEFNFIIASFALSEGLVNPDIYSAIVFSVLCASIFGPLILARVIAYYNAKSQAYLSGSHPIERDGDTSDGFRPLYLAIQARTPIHWGLQDSFKKALDDAGLIIIDHRSWHTLGLNAIDITELFVQDTRVKVRVCACFETRKAAAAAAANSGESVAILLPIQKGQVPESATINGSATSQDTDAKDSETSSSQMEKGKTEDEIIRARCDEIKQLLSNCLLPHDTEDYVIQVSQWQTYTFDNQDLKGSDDDKKFYRFNLHQPTELIVAPSEVSAEDSLPTASEVEPLRRPALYRRSSTITVTDDPTPADEPMLSGPDLWESDEISHAMTRDGYVMSPVPGGIHRSVTAGLVGEAEHGHHPEPYHRRRITFDAALLTTHGDELETSMIKERLHGYVRPHL